MSEQRIKWDDYFLKIAEITSERGTCDRAKVGCIIVKDNSILSTGYNGSISGHEHCDDVGHLLNDEQRCIRTIHAEQNAIIQALKQGVSIKESTAYVTHAPCETCTKLLNQSGVERIVYRKAYENKYNQFFVQGMVIDHVETS